MSSMPNPFGAARPGTLGYESSTDSVTRAQFFNAVYAWMASGLALTAVVAWYVSTQPNIIRAVFGSGLIWVLFIAQLGLVFGLSAAVSKISSTVATLMFMVYAGLNGVTLSIIFLAYRMPSITGAFVVTAGMFGAMSIYGMTTKRDLTRLGSLLFMALIGLILASVVNIFWANSTLYWLVTYGGVLIFVGLTAYDTQKLRAIAVQTAGNREMSARYSIYGALTLYLDFINLFLYMLRIMGDRRN
jgi:FtsH-binding integral membrane protein